jgi:RNA recognition motif-containing protein
MESSIRETLAAISSPEELEAALGQVSFDELSGETRQDVAAALVTISQNNEVTGNAKLRRKLKRLIEQLADEKLVRGKAATTNKDVDDIDMIANAGSFVELEGALNALAVPSDSETDRINKLKAVLEDISRPNSRPFAINKTIRRRISRLVFALSGQEEKQKLKELKKSQSQSVAPISKKVVPPSAAPSVSRRPAQAQAPADEVMGWEKGIREAASADGLEQLLAQVTAEKVGNRLLANKILEALSAVSSNGDIKFNAKLRRRVERLQSSLEALEDSPAPQSSLISSSLNKETKSVRDKGAAAKPFISAAEKAPSKAPISKGFGQAKAPDVDAAILSRLEGLSDAEVYDALLQMKYEGIPLTERQRLRKTLVKLSEEVTSVKINAKSRRKLKRMIESMDEEPASAQQVSAAAVQIEIKEPAKTAPDPHESSHMELANDHESKHIPYVVFIGQLDFKVTAADVERHLRSGGVEGPVKVRLNLDPATKKSKGTAFVELEGPREMHKCLGLHHTKLGGRRINVEKTCGGRNKELRSQRIKELRVSQKIKASEAIDGILKEFELSGLLKGRLEDSVMNRLYACTPSEVRGMFETMKREKESGAMKGSHADLERILTAHDEGGSHVDQSRQLGYGPFNKKRMRSAERLASSDDHSAAGENGVPVAKKQAKYFDSTADLSRKGDVISDFEKLKRPEDQKSNLIQEISQVFPSMRGRGGKLLSSRK